MSKKTKWLIQSTLGLVLTGAGLSMAIDAGFEKYSGNPWILYGTLALVVFNSGICLTIDAGIQYHKNRT
ncbi:MAG: hypothetical protein MUE71_02715 [Chitinophagaceae bacterium]|jgi:hypothetical protein|nr:hypothetical protein [Chitinophagaceae bacterium]